MKNFIIFRITIKSAIWFPDGPEFPMDTVTRTFEAIGTAFAPSATAAVKFFGSRDCFKAVEA